MDGSAQLAHQPAHQTTHLIEPPRAYGGRTRGRESSLLAFASLREHGLIEPGPVVLLGDDSSRRFAQAHGVAWDHSITPRAGRIGVSWRAIQRDVAHAGSIRCWSRDALRVVAGVLPRKKAVDVRATLLGSPRGAWDRRAVSRLADRLTMIDVFDASDADAWRRAGVRPDRIRVHDAGGACAPSRGTRITLPGTRPGQLVLTTLTDHPREADARRFSFLLAILSVGEYACIGLCPSGARHMEAGRRYHRLLGNRHGFQVSDRPTIELLAAADMCVWPDPTQLDAPRGARSLLRATAERFGVTIIDPPEYANPAGPTPPEMVRPALRLFETPKSGHPTPAPPTPPTALAGNAS